MCGIVGMYGPGASTEVVTRMMAPIRHRGPDGHGRYASQEGTPVALGHHRLSIIDVSDAGQQPMRKHGLVLVYNGEIYNYRELRAELTALGARFQGASDTEVLLEAWHRWGTSSLERLRGMFAFAMYDEREKDLVLARDRFGIKPLYYAQVERGFAFASEVRGLVPALPNRPTLSSAGFASYVMLSWVPDSRCIYEGVHKVQPGHWVRVRGDGQVATGRYADPMELLAPGRKVPDPEELLETLRTSVGVHLVSDVPIGFFLSGGLDSSLISVLASRQTHPCRAFTIAFREEDRGLEAMPDDLPYARRVAADHGIDLDVITVEPDVDRIMSLLDLLQDEPLGDAAALNAFLISERAAESGIKVLLSGMGADEMFGGYRKHLAGLMAGYYRRLPGPLRSGLVEPMVRALPVGTRTRGFRLTRWAQRFVSFAGMDEAQSFLWSYAHHGPQGIRSLLPDHLHDAALDVEEEHRARFEQCKDCDPVTRMCFTDTGYFLPGLNLAYTDRASMAASVEVRVPFVDQEVARAAFALPSHRKIHGTETKVALKEAGAMILPRDVAFRPKALFSAPLRAWIGKDLQGVVDEQLVDGSLVEDGWVDRRAVTRLVDEDRKKVADRAKEIWSLLALEVWYRRHQSSDLHNRPDPSFDGTGLAFAEQGREGAP